MRVGLRVCLAAIGVLAATVSVAVSQPAALPTLADLHLPAWPFPPPDPPKDAPQPPPDDGQPHHLPGSTQAFTVKEADGQGAVDWFPDRHPPAPPIVVNGMPGSFFGCGNCHLFTGVGKPDMQSLNGLPVAYMRQQLEDFKNDLRHTSVADGATTGMIHVAKTVSDADAEAALAYFHAVGPVKWIRVVETATVPKTLLGKHGMWVPNANGVQEPLGNRILEMPLDYDRSLVRDPTSIYMAYVPPGSLKKGAALAKTGAGGRITPCVTCHGANLRGMGDINPPIAGRSPSATGRQLFDFRTGARHGKNSAAMKAVVEKMTDDDILNVTAYLASLPQ